MKFKIYKNVMFDIELGLRILFLTSVFLGTGLCAVFLFIQGDTFWGTLVVIFKMLFLVPLNFYDN